MSNGKEINGYSIMSDFRIYYYEFGQLKKLSAIRINGGGHKGYSTLQHAERRIEYLRSNEYRWHKIYRRYQFVIVEYTGPYESKIIKIIN